MDKILAKTKYFDVRSISAEERILYPVAQESIPLKWSFKSVQYMIYKIRHFQAFCTSAVAKYKNK